MLAVLHKTINSIVPILGVADNGDGTYRVDYIENPTEEQLVLVNAAIADYPLMLAKEQKLEQINNEWAARENAGWDSGQGFSLGITSSDVALLVGVFSLAKEAAALGLPMPSLISTTNTTVSFNNIQEMTNLLLQYGQARSALADTFAAKRKAVADATTIEEVNAVA